MTETKARFPSQPWPDGTAAAYLEDWLEMAQQVGIERFTLAVKKARTETTFFPLPKEIRECIPEPDMKPQTVIDPGCKLCEGTGWKRIKIEGKADRVTRCDCRRIEFVRTA